MSDWFVNFIATGIENKASEWILLLNRAAMLRIDGKSFEIADLVLDRGMLETFVLEYMTKRQVNFYQKMPDGDFVNEDFLINMGEDGRFLANMQRRNGQLEIIIRRPLRNPSRFFEILSYAVTHDVSDIHVRQDKYVRMRKSSRIIETSIMTDSDFLEKGIAVHDHVVYLFTGCQDHIIPVQNETASVWDRHRIILLLVQNLSSVSLSI